MKVVIMAGGKGTRISSIANDIPKPMIKIGNKPILEHEINCLKQQGFTDIIITVSHLSNIIMDYFKDGKEFGVNIEYYVEKIPLGNAGALFKLKDKLNDDFLLLNADALFNIDFNRFVKYHQNKKALVTLFTHPNDHPYDSGLIIVDEENQVVNWLTKEEKRPQWYRNIVNAGLHIISPKILKRKIDKERIDLDRDLLKPLVGKGIMYSYNSPEYVKDMGTPDRYYQVCDDFISGKILKKNLMNKQKAIFLDRDGTINKYVGFLKDIEQFELLENVAKAIKLINNSEYLAIVITNQPVIARGEVTYEELFQIHEKMETLLGNEGAYLNNIYFCPHHPDSGFVGEIKELKIQCNCRKPNIGMIMHAQKDFNIDLEKSWIIGDSENDILTGIKAGCNTAYISSDINNSSFNMYTIKGESLFECVKKILDRGEKKC